MTPKIRGTHAFDFEDPVVTAQLEQINNEPFRSRVIVQFSVIEALLGKILSLHFIAGQEEALLRPDGPLGPVKNRARTCLALGLINQSEFDDIDRYAKIRNMLAHRFDVSSSGSDPEVRKWLLETTFMKNLPGDKTFTDDMSLIAGIFYITHMLKFRLKQIRRCSVTQESVPITWS